MPFSLIFMDVFIFNPDTDFALAKGRATYTPPLRIDSMRHHMALTQLPMASPGDIILLSTPGESANDLHEETVREAEKRDIRIMNISEFSSFQPESYRLLPWGWNHSLRRLLKNSGIDEKFLKSEEEIDKLRELAHRRTTIPFRKMMGERFGSFKFPTTIETDNTDEALDFTRNFDTVYFKAPWSSSGRGVIKTGSMTGNKLREWISGTIRRQRSVMAEEGLKKKLDFATEWWIQGSEARFLGFSMFEASAEGRYLSNDTSSQNEIRNRLLSFLPCWDNQILEIQKSALENLIAPYYNGPAGIDMLADDDLSINPCVEINLRQTMGMVSLQKPLRELLS